MCVCAGCGHLFICSKSAGNDGEPKRTSVARNTSAVGVVCAH